MLVLTPKYDSQIDLDLIKKQKDTHNEPLINHRNDIIYLTYCKDIKEAYLTFLDNKDKYSFICYKPKNTYEIKYFALSLGEIDTLDVSWIDVSELDSLENCFYACEAKHIIGLEKWDVSNATDMHSMFDRCYKLESISDISGWDVSNVINMGFMFYYCEKLKSIGDISGWNVSNVKDMGHMFLGCKNLESIGDISGWDIINVKYMNSMFDLCKNLKSVGDIEQWSIDNQQVRLMFMFYLSGIKPIPSWYTK